MLQNESVNEDVEHFEDIDEENIDKKPTKSSEVDNASKIVSTDDSIDTDGDSSQEEDVCSASNSETDISDEEEDLLAAGGLEDVKETKELPDLTEQQPQVSFGKSSLPGGYNPRHREPSYWYFHILTFLEMDSSCVSSRMHSHLGLFWFALLISLSSEYFSSSVDSCLFVSYYSFFLFVSTR